MCHRHDPLWKVEDVSEYLGVPKQTIYEWRMRRYGPKAFRVGRFLRFKESDVFAWLDEQTTAA